MLYSFSCFQKRKKAACIRVAVVMERWVNINKNSNHKRTLKRLRKHRNNNTIPKQLQLNVEPALKLSDDLRKKWDSCLLGCSTKLTNILITHHEEQLSANPDIPALMDVDTYVPVNLKIQQMSQSGICQNLLAKEDNWKEVENDMDSNCTVQFKPIAVQLDIVAKERLGPTKEPPRSVH